MLVKREGRAPVETDVETDTLQTRPCFQENDDFYCRHRTRQTLTRIPHISKHGTRTSFQISPVRFLTPSHFNSPRQVFTRYPALSNEPTLNICVSRRKTPSPGPKDDRPQNSLRSALGAPPPVNPHSRHDIENNVVGSTSRLVEFESSWSSYQACTTMLHTISIWTALVVRWCLVKEIQKDFLNVLQVFQVPCTVLQQYMDSQFIISISTSYSGLKVPNLRAAASTEQSFCCGLNLESIQFLPALSLPLRSVNLISQSSRQEDRA